MISQDNSRTHTCPTCGQTNNYYWHRLSPGLAFTLVKFRRAIRAKGENSIHLQRDMTGANELTKTEYANAQKLRFHGLIAHDELAGTGYWLLTKRGRQFLDGELSVPRRVQTLNNGVTDHDPVYVTIEEVTQQRPVFDDFEFWHRTKEPQGVELAQVGLFNFPGIEDGTPVTVNFKESYK